jgi:hypothetical protein
VKVTGLFTLALVLSTWSHALAQNGNPKDSLVFCGHQLTLGMSFAEVKTSAKSRRGEDVNVRSAKQGDDCDAALSSLPQSHHDPEVFDIGGTDEFTAKYGDLYFEDGRLATVRKAWRIENDYVAAYDIAKLHAQVKILQKGQDWMCSLSDGSQQISLDCGEARITVTAKGLTLNSTLVTHDDEYSTVLYHALRQLSSETEGPCSLKTLEISTDKPEDGGIDIGCGQRRMIIDASSFNQNKEIEFVGEINESLYLNSNPVK